MKFTALWTAHAQARLADLWLHTHDRRALSDASDAIDDLLRNDAQHIGESRGGDARIYHCLPLGVIFDVYEADRKAVVLDVWLFTKRP